MSADEPAIPSRPPETTFGARLATIIEASGLNQSEFADGIGITRSMLNRWLNDRLETQPRRSNLRNIALLLNYPTGPMLEHLEKGVPLPHPVVPRRVFIHKGSMPEYAATTTPESQRRVEPGRIPVRNKISAGEVSYHTNEDHVAGFAYETVDSGPWAGPGSEAWYVHGDSMLNDFANGDLVIGDPNVPVDPDGCFAIVQFGPEKDERNCVRYVRKTKGGTLLVPRNRAYDDELIEDPAIIRMMVRIVEHRRRVR